MDILKVPWQEVNKRLRTVTEAQAAALLEAERRARRRPMYLVRFYGKFSMLRKQRERQELLKDMLKGAQ